MTDQAEPMRVESRHCYYCGAFSDAVQPAAAETGPPEPGSILLCLYCAAVTLVGADHEQFVPSEAVLSELFADAPFQQEFNLAMMQRAVMMVGGQLPRPSDE